ncbi:hypothetical protein AgCh_023552 [Apium graveolens]
MVDAIVSSAIEKLGAFIAQEVNILLEVKDNLRWLKDELRYLQSSVRSAESRLEEEQIRNWVEDVRDVANDAIKILSDFSAHQQEYAAPKQGILDHVRACVCVCNKEVMLYDIGKEIESLQKRILVIKNSELRNFDTRAKVCVSNDYNIKDVLKRIIKSFMGPEHEQYMSTMDEYDLLQYLTKLLEDRGCYLALIDDIWDIKAWIQIKDAFPDQKNGSRIIITTRNKRVAEMADDKCFVHRLRFLTEDESWELFCKRAEPTPNLKKLGREMVGKCRGLPLAIVVLSGLLSHNMSYDYWSKVKEHIWRHLKDNDLSPQIGEILSLSFNDLSPQMKDCFLYLARYPEDHGIDLDELKRIWIAEEFISEAEEGEGVIMEDLAEDCLKELINRNLLQVNKLLWNGEVESFRVHDLVRDLSINKAKVLLVISDSECKEWMKIDTVNLTNLHALSICDREEEEAEEEGYTLESVANLTSLQTFSLRFMSVNIPTLKPLSSCNRLKP